MTVYSRLCRILFVYIGRILATLLCVESGRRRYLMFRLLLKFLHHGCIYSIGIYYYELGVGFQWMTSVISKMTNLGKGAFLVGFLAINMCVMLAVAEVPISTAVSNSNVNAGIVDPQVSNGESIQFVHESNASAFRNLKVDELIQIVKIQQEKLRELEFRQHEASDKGFTFVTWVGVLLACVTVIVTILGVAIALVTFFGYRATIAKAESVAALKAIEAGEKEIAKQFAAGGFDAAIQEAVDKVVYRGMSNSELNQGFDEGEA